MNTVTYNAVQANVDFLKNVLIYEFQLNSSI